MAKKNNFKKLAPLLKKPYFTSLEAKTLSITPSLLCYYVKAGKLRRISRGVYQSTSFTGEVNFIWEDLIEATYSIPQGVICLISALSIYNLTEEIPKKHWIAIPHTTSAKTNNSIKIVRFRNISLGKTSLKIGDAIVPIFDKERVIIDAFRYLSREVALKALKLALKLPRSEKIDLIKLEHYAKKLRFNITTYLITMTIE